MAPAELPYANLILPDNRGLDPRLYVESAAHVLARLDSPNGKATIRDGFARGETFAITVTPDPDGDYGPVVTLRVLHRKGQTVDPEFAAHLLSDTILGSLAHSPCDMIEWYAPGVLIDREDFLRLHSYVSPRRPAGRGPLHSGSHLRPPTELNELRTDMSHAPGAGAKEDATADAVSVGVIAQDSAPDPAQSRIGAASWLMTATLATVSLPVAASLAVVGLLRGMQFRLVTQVMTVTMLFVALDTADSFNGLYLLLGH